MNPSAFATGTERDVSLHDTVDKYQACAPYRTIGINGAPISKRRVPCKMATNEDWKPKTVVNSSTVFSLGHVVCKAASKKYRI